MYRMIIRWLMRQIVAELTSPRVIVGGGAKYVPLPATKELDQTPL